MKCIIRFMLSIITNVSYLNDTFTITRTFKSIDQLNKLSFNDTTWINPNVHCYERPLDTDNNNCIQVLCTYPHMRKDLFNSSNNELSNTRYLNSPECLLTFLFCDPLVVSASECIVIENIGQYSSAHFNNGKIKFQESVRSPFSNVMKSTVVFYAPLFNQILKNQIHYNETLTYILADLIKLQPIMELYNTKELCFYCCGCEKSKRDYSQLHFIEQWIMASLYKRKMVYYTNGNKNLEKADMLYNKAKDTYVKFFYEDLSTQMNGISSKISVMQIWGTQIPVFHYLIKYYDILKKTSDKRGFFKSIDNLYKKSIETIMKTNKTHLGLSVTLVALSAVFGGNAISAYYYGGRLASSYLQNNLVVSGLAAYCSLLTSFLDSVKKRKNKSS